MSKRKRPRRASATVIEQGKANWWKTFLEYLAVFSAILGIVAFVLSNAPKLSVDVSGSLQPANPMSTVFYLSNDGLLPVHDVVVACGAPQLKAGKYEIESEQDARFLFPDSKAAKLSPGHKMTLPCAHLVGVADPASITEAEITIIADYRPDWVPWHKTARFPWKAEKTENGSWIWKSVPRYQHAFYPKPSDTHSAGARSLPQRIQDCN
jgi:hypothetical protein